MANPAGNYPGRQIFLGKTASEGQKAFVYLVTGRSEPSQHRYATPYIAEERAIRMKHINPKEPFDPFRHYQAVKINPDTGLLVVSNSQAPVDAVMEKYNFADPLDNGRFLERQLAILGPEYDTPIHEKRTSRIVGVVHPSDVFALGITVKDYEGFQRSFDVKPGEFVWISTYNGEVEYSNFDPKHMMALDTLHRLSGRTPKSLAREVYDASDYIDPKYDDLRVSSIAGILDPDGWHLYQFNRREPLDE